MTDIKPFAISRIIYLLSLTKLSLNNKELLLLMCW